jgi:hypothetical protein
MKNVFWDVAPCSPYKPTAVSEAISLCETSVKFCETIQLNIPYGSHLQIALDFMKALLIFSTLRLIIKH